MIDSLPMPVVFWGSIGCSFLALVVLVVAFVLLLRWLGSQAPDDDDEK
jgi:hypothetical protein